MLLSGPRTQTLGTEPTLTCNYIAKSGGGDHLYDSCIIDDGTTTCIKNNLIGTGTACFTGTLCANYLYSTTNVLANDTIFTGGNIRKLADNQCIFFRNAAGNIEATIGGTGNVGIGTCTPTAQLQVSGTIATGDENTGWGRILFDTNVLKVQASKNGTDPIGISFWTQASGGAFTEKMRIACDGKIGIGTVLPNASLSINACKSLATVSGQACISSGVNDTGCIFFGLGDANSTTRTGMYGMQCWNGSFTDYTTKFTLTKGGVGNIDWLSVNNNGFASFTCQISTPTIITNNSSGFAACITSCSTDYSMYIRNMSSGFPLSIYTVGDSNGVNDDLKAIKIARSSNDNQFLALSLIYGGFGYGYKLAPRYYNGAAYVCGNPTVIDGYGNVGINNTSPTMPLSVGGCANIDRLAVNWSCFNSFGEHLQIRGCARLFLGQFRVSYGPGDGNYIFLAHDDTNGYLCICRTVYAGNLILSPYGGVGINTSSITGKLSVNSGINTSSATVMTLQQATNGAVKDAVGFGVSIQNGGEATNAADLSISTATGGALCERMRITSGGVICFNNTVCAPVVQQPTGFTVYSFPINYGSSFVDISSGNYLSLGGTEPGTMNSYCAYAHGGISPRAVGSNTEGMSWTCLRFVLRVGSPVGDVSTTPTYLQTAGYFYSTGFYGIGTCVNIAVAMDGSRGYSTVVLPWIPYSSFNNPNDVTGFAIRNIGPTTTRIGSVFIQYK
jgi:hypothetical protein